MRATHAFSRFTLGWRLAAALVLGVTVGAVAGPRCAALRPLADLLLALLKGLAVPAVVASVLVGVSGISPRRTGALGVRLASAFVVLAGAASVAGVGGALLTFGSASRVRPPALDPPLPLPSADFTRVGWRSGALTLEQVIPTTLLVALMIGFAVATWRERDPGGPSAALHEAFRRFAILVDRALGLVLVYLPVGVFALVATAVGTAGGARARGLANALAAVYVAQAVTALALLALAALRGEPLRGFLAATRDALVTALATGSSAASLPLETRAAVDGLRREPVEAAFALSLGSALSKAGTAAFLGALGAAALFLEGPPVESSRLAHVVLAATIAALTTPPVAGGGFIMLGFVAQQAGLPLELVALLLGVPLVGKGNTPVNALGRLVCVAVLIAPAHSARAARSRAAARHEPARAECG